MSSTAQIFPDCETSPLSVLDLPRPSAGPCGANRRFVPRMCASFIARPREGGPSYDGIDISFGGIMCNGGRLTWPGNQLELDLILPGEATPVRVVGRVVELVTFRKKIAMRIRFESITMANRKRIALWMARTATV